MIAFNAASESPDGGREDEEFTFDTLSDAVEDDIASSYALSIPYVSLADCALRRDIKRTSDRSIGVVKPVGEPIVKPEEREGAPKLFLIGSLLLDSLPSASTSITDGSFPVSILLRAICHCVRT